MLLPISESLAPTSLVSEESDHRPDLILQFNSPLTEEITSALKSYVHTEHGLQFKRPLKYIPEIYSLQLFLNSCLIYLTSLPEIAHFCYYVLRETNVKYFHKYRLVFKKCIVSFDRIKVVKLQK